MKRYIIMLLLALTFLLCRTPPAEAAMTYGGTFYLSNRAYLGSGAYNDPLYRFISEVENSLDGTSGVTSFILTPSTQPTAAEGKLYYDSAANGLKVYNGTAWQTLDVAGGTSLDQSYDLGAGITVDGGAVTLTTSAASDSAALAIVHGETGNYAGMTLTNASAYPAIQITTSGAGADITGTSATWSISKAGAITAVGLDTTGDITLENDETIKNDTNNEIEFGNGTEDLSFNFATSNTITLATDSGVDSIAMGVCDDLEGVGTIVFDAAAASITLTADAGAEDLTITQAGSVDASLVLYSAGTGADSVKMYSAAGIDIDSVDDLAITNTATTSADDFVITQAGAQDASLILTAGGTGADALSLITSHASGDIKVSSGDMLDIDAADDITIDLAGAAGEDITVTNTGGSIQVVATEADAGAILIQASGAGGDLNFDSVLGRIEIEAEEDAADAVYIIADGGTSSTLTLFNDTGTAADSIELLTDVGGITATASAGAIVLTATGASAGDMTLTAGDDMTATVGGDLTLAVTGTVSAGGSAITYSNAWIEEISADEAVAATDSGKTFVVLGDGDGECVCTLPTAAAGLTFTFIDANGTAAADLWITAGAGDKINGGTAQKSYVAQDDSIQSSVTLTAIDAENWVIVSQFGEEWANDNN